ncbi:hypothetical protein FB45DRAFT_846927 [Roridomyces roridus]|uniref:Uncharacterized protein n=1 Tax=Roridomyces roridus TaxID=1738132 RepID=A0AAD7B0W9_9AGAR|nr:hypothetical protein FB45DRAFT_846927 [Roridomyces roridus]
MRNAEMNRQRTSRHFATKILAYQGLLSFLGDACRAQATHPEVLQIQRQLDGYWASMASENVIQVLVNSPGYKKMLLGLYSELGLADEAKLRSALRADEDRIEAHIVAILDSKAKEQAVLALEGDSAQGFLDVVQSALDRGFLVQQEHARKAHRIVRKLSEACDKLPSSLFITGVVDREMHPSFGGGFGDVYRARYDNKTVALKHMRYFARGSQLRDMRLVCCTVVRLCRR